MIQYHTDEWLKHLFVYLAGGSSGSRGRNILFYQDGRKINLGGKASVKVKAGVCLLYIFERLELLDWSGDA